MADCLVVGGNGFLGSHLVDGLSQAGHAVSAFDRFSSGTRAYAASDVNQVIGDFADTGAVTGAVAGHDTVFHFLSTTAPATVDSDPSLDIRTNVIETVALLDACVEQGVKRVFFASTGGAIYGDQGKDSYHELDPTLPVSPYAIGKLALEHYLRYYRIRHGLESIALRISNPYGTRQHEGRTQGLIPIALRNQLARRPTVRYGDGGMVRDYVYIDDMIDMIVPMTSAQISHEVYNIGSGVGRTVSEVFSVIEAVTGSPLLIDEKPTPRTFIDRVVLDTARYRSEFGSVPITDLDEGIRASWTDIRDA